MKKQNKIKKYMLNTEKPYKIKLGEMTVEMEYSENGKKFNEYMLNILRKKMEK